jgi:hypothetical protein
MDGVPKDLALELAENAWVLALKGTVDRPSLASPNQQLVILNILTLHLTKID